MKLLLVRHGETSTNKVGLMHKSKDSALLNGLGKQQAYKVAEFCREFASDALYSSPEVRAQETAAIISSKVDLSITTLNEFKEREWGKWQGKPWQEIKMKLEKLSLEERYRFIPPNGESWEQMEVRLREGLYKVVSKHNKVSAVITHGGVIRALIPLLKKESRRTSFQYDPSNGSVTIFEYQDGEYKEVVLCATDHLH